MFSRIFDFTYVKLKIQIFDLSCYRATKITAMLCQDGLIRETEVFLSHGKIYSIETKSLAGKIGGTRGLGKTHRRDGKESVWFVITPVNPETKVPMTDQAHC